MKGRVVKEKDGSLCPHGAKNLFKTQMLITQSARICVECPILINNTKKYMVLYQ